MTDRSDVHPELPASTRLPKEKVSFPHSQRALGVIVGAAVGDALGAPFEFRPAGTYRDTFPARVLVGETEMIGGGSFGWKPAEFTDDTQMALALAESLISHRAYDPDDLWWNWREWASDAADVGVTTRAALSFERWQEVRHRRPEHTAANGALMRVFPLALALLGKSDDDARAIVRHQASLTHHHPDAGWGAWFAVAMMRAAITRTADDDDFGVFEELADELDYQLRNAPADVAERFEPLLAPTWKPGAAAEDSNGNIWNCLAQAVWAVRSTTSFEQAVVAAVNLGGDADTVACVTGAIAGAIYGIQGIPSRWATRINGSVRTAVGTKEYDLRGLLDTGRRLIRSAEKPLTPNEDSAGPGLIEDRLHAANLLGAAGVPTDWGVVSLCRTTDQFVHHPHQRQIYMLDDERNSNLGAAVKDAVEAIDAFLAEGRNVVVHCHGGRSRTGLVLKAWKMGRDGLTHTEAHTWLRDRWSRYATWNESFLEFLDREWRSIVPGAGGPGDGWLDDDLEGMTIMDLYTASFALADGPPDDFDPADYGMTADEAIDYLDGFDQNRERAEQILDRYQSEPDDDYYDDNDDE